MASSFTEAGQQKTSKRIRAICRRMYQLLNKVYILARPSDNAPYFAVRTVQILLEEPTEEKYVELLERKGQVWHSIIQVGVDELGSLELAANRLARAAWFLTMASGEFYQDKLDDAKPHINTVVEEIKGIKKLLDREKVRA